VEATPARIKGADGGGHHGFGIVKPAGLMSAGKIAECMPSEDILV